MQKLISPFFTRFFLVFFQFYVRYTYMYFVGVSRFETVNETVFIGIQPKTVSRTNKVNVNVDLT